MENKFCFLKGVVDCDSGVIQNCNNMRLRECPLEKTEMEDKAEDMAFCYLKGLVDCGEWCVQDCNNKRLKQCPKD